MAMRVPVAREGIPIIAIFMLVSAVGTWFIGHWLAICLLWLLAVWCVWFFRDPERHIPPGEGLLLAPADGRVCAIEEVPSAPLTGDPARKLSIFMNVFNVHVNRLPASGCVADRVYHPGQFLNAALDKASIQNERMEILLTLKNGIQLPFVQVAGLIARRIVCRVRKGQVLQRGDRFGLIRFGSRVDVYLPLSASVALVLGDRTIAGETIIARLENAGE
jgi:phosphatidylserine decarboxylase